MFDSILDELDDRFRMEFIAESETEIATVMFNSDMFNLSGKAETQ